MSTRAIVVDKRGKYVKRYYVYQDAYPDRFGRRLERMRQNNISLDTLSPFDPAGESIEPISRKKE